MSDSTHRAAEVWWQMQVVVVKDLPKKKAGTDKTGKYEVLNKCFECKFKTRPGDQLNATLRARWML